MTGVSQGTATITAATADGKGRAAQIPVEIPKSSEIVLNFGYDSAFSIDETNEIILYVDTPRSAETSTKFPVIFSFSDQEILSIKNPDIDPYGDKWLILEGLKPGTTMLTVTTPDGGAAHISVTVRALSIDDYNTALTVKDQTYTGKAFEPAVTVKRNGKTLRKGTDYTVSYKNNTKPGKATVTVKGKGNYTGGVSTTFAINPKKVAGLKLAAGKQQITVCWTRDSTVSGYELQYGLKKSEPDSTLVTVGKTAANKAIKKLTAGKTYYVRIRSFKKVGSAKYYSQWSAYKKIKVK